MFIKFIYGVTFSMLYHSHHSLPDDKVFTTDYDYDNWALLDGYACSSLIFTTVLYGLRVREPQLYITSFSVENIVLIAKIPLLSPDLKLHIKLSNSLVVQIVIKQAFRVGFLFLII